MPTFTARQPDLTVSGPLVAVEVTLSAGAEAAEIKAGNPVPTPLTLSGMIDTGASATVLQQGLPAKLGLQPVGTTQVNTPTSQGVVCPLYSVRVVLPSRIVVEVIAVEAPLAGQNIQCLIGRDVLAGGVFVYIGYAETFSFSL